MARSRRSGFTLVELLVVIGIIALLISILLPSLSKARNQANLVKCGSNLRELGNALRLYATANRDACPIGFLAGGVGTSGTGTSLTVTGTFDAATGGAQPQFSYIAYWRNSNGDKPTVLGVLATTRLLLSGKAFFCPSETNELWMWDKPLANAWAFDTQGNVVATPGYTGHSRVGYCTRPAAVFAAIGTTNDPLGRAAAPLLLENLYTGLATTKYPQVYPTFRGLKNKAICADLLLSPFQLRNRHAGSFNVLYGSGAVLRLEESVLSKNAKLAGARPGVAGKSWAGISTDTAHQKTLVGDPYVVSSSDMDIFLAKTPPANAADKTVWQVLDDQSK
ncbi:MAG: prepilin-type N-terminal cleavage/methylation domain-containing protein [Tepidisphaeraceae bacterium]